MTFDPQWDAATQALQQAQSVLIVTHVNPDGDAIGSALGLANAIKAMDKAVTVCVDDGVPDYLKFLPGADNIQSTLIEGEWDLLISTDASDEERTGLVGAYGREHSQQIINLDHHVTNTGFGDIHLVMTEAVSAAEIVYHWWTASNVPLTLDVATPLLTGIVTDTRGFRVSSVKPATLDVARQLMQQGVSLTEIIARTLDSMSHKTFQLWKLALPEASLEEGVIYTAIKQSYLEHIDEEKLSDGGLISTLIQVNEAMVAVIFKEQADNTVRLSMRCKPGFNVATLAHSLGGGGHKQASGATVTGTLEEVMQQVIPELKAVVAQGTLDIV